MTAKHLLLAAALAAAPSVAKDKPADPRVGARALPGLMAVNVDERGGRLLVTLPPAGADGVSLRLLYTPSLATGLGAAPTMLDRGRLGETRLLAFRRVGAKVVIAFENPRFRGPAGAASTDFAASVAWMGDATMLPDGSAVVDIAPFLTADSLGIARSLGQEDDPLGTAGGPQGAGRGFRLNAALSVATLSSARQFPDNLEVDAVQTYASDQPGEEVANIAPDPARVSFTVHHSFVRLPPPGFVPRAFDARMGGFATQGVDYSRPLGRDVVFDVANRFRLEKVTPGPAPSPVRKPITFYLDRAAPEPMATALIEGIGWWRAAFDAAGFQDAFRVERLPEGADPLDARYNMVNWVDRATRGWSYGQEVVDPRTGEIVRGVVVLGSERVRQDVLIFEALVGAAATGRGGRNDPAQVALARLRQLGAHEVGHALGFAHNFAASTQGRGSVMDYPPPRIGLKDGRPDLSDAYGTGIGAWDRATAAWLYADAPAGVGDGQRFVPDDVARAPDTAQPWGGLWDDGADPVAELGRLMTVRRAAIDGFGPGALPAGEQLAELRRRFVPVYLLHRYQLVAAAKSVGGVDFGYRVAGAGDPAAHPVPGDRQRAATAAILDTLSPAALAVPPGVAALLSTPRNGTDNRQFDIELFRTAGGPVFDPLAAADVAATLALNTLMAPARLQRLEVQHAADPALPGMAELLDRIEARVLPPRTDAVGRRVAWRALAIMAQVSRRPDTAPEVALLLSARLRRIGQALATRAGPPDERAWAAELSRRLLDPEALERMVADRPREARVPPGDPIGGGDWLGGGE